MSARAATRALTPSEQLDVRREIARDNPAEPEAWALLSAAYAAVGQRAQAIHAKRISIEAEIARVPDLERLLRGPQLALPFQGLAEVFLDEQLFDDSLDMLRRAARVAEDRATSLSYARTLADFGRADEAVSELRRIARRWPDAETYGTLGMACAQVGRQGEARDALVLSHELDPAWVNDEIARQDLLLALLDREPGYPTTA